MRRAARERSRAWTRYEQRSVRLRAGLDRLIIVSASATMSDLQQGTLLSLGAAIIHCPERPFPFARYTITVAAGGQPLQCSDLRLKPVGL